MTELVISNKTSFHGPWHFPSGRKSGGCGGAGGRDGGKFVTKRLENSLCEHCLTSP